MKKIESIKAFLEVEELSILEQGAIEGGQQKCKCRCKCDGNNDPEDEFIF